MDSTLDESTNHAHQYKPALIGHREQEGQQTKNVNRIAIATLRSQIAQAEVPEGSDL